MSHYYTHRRRRPGSRNAVPRGGRWDHVFGVLDLGTNNCRLLVVRPSRNGFRVIDSFSRIVRLGEGVGQNGRLGDEAMDRTVGALKICAGKMKKRSVTLSRSVATAACRGAVNCSEFVARVADETGIDLDIIGTGEEAQLAAAACSPLMDEDCETALIFDIGGGSTEIIWACLCKGKLPELIEWMSLPVGVATLAETHGGRNVSACVYRRMVEDIEPRLAPFEASHNLRPEVEAGRTQMLGTSGTVTTLAAIKMGLRRYQRNVVDGAWLSARDIHEVSAELAAMAYGERARHPCIGKGRADLVIAGCAIFEAIFRTWPAPRVRVADRGVREGMLFHLMEAADAAAAPAAHG